MEITTIDLVLINILSYFLGIGTGLIVCCRYKNKFMERVKSNDDLSRYNHQYRMPEPHTIMASAPVNPEPTTITINK
tara:strand:+ start:160 stop:390 length:231 start_codon:yes stop_codon:yes gene_type:complete